MEDPDAWKTEIADAQWKKGRADAQKRGWKDVKPSEFSAAEAQAAREAQAAIKKREQQRLARLAHLARMRWLLGAS